MFGQPVTKSGTVFLENFVYIDYSKLKASNGPNYGFLEKGKGTPCQWSELGINIKSGKSILISFLNWKETISFPITLEITKIGVNVSLNKSERVLGVTLAEDISSVTWVPKLISITEIGAIKVFNLPKDYVQSTTMIKQYPSDLYDNFDISQLPKKVDMPITTLEEDINFHDKSRGATGVTVKGDIGTAIDGDLASLSLSGTLNFQSLQDKDSMTMTAKLESGELIFSGIWFKTQDNVAGPVKLKIFNWEIDLATNPKQYDVPFCDAEILYSYLKGYEGNKNCFALEFITSDKQATPIWLASLQLKGKKLEAFDPDEFKTRSMTNILRLKQKSVTLNNESSVLIEMT
jgi:hypothetical protein